jgi:hypothetical protein
LVRNIHYIFFSRFTMDPSLLMKDEAYFDRLFHDEIICHCSSNHRWRQDDKM